VRDPGKYWELPHVLPRAVIDADTLRIVLPLYADPDDRVTRDTAALGPKTHPAAEADLRT
jgi:hypothetical protein